MRKCLLALAGVAVIGLIAPSAMAAIGDSWILPTADLQGSGWIEYPGAGYGGASAWGANTTSPLRRLYWTLDQAGIPASVELYTIQWFVPLQGGLDWQVINVPADASIPWQPLGGNQQQIMANPAPRGTWGTTGPGPRAPTDNTFSAGLNGTYLWLHAGSNLYANWDPNFGWAFDATWSALKITQVTADGQLPEPTTVLLLAFGGAGLLRRKPRV